MLFWKLTAQALLLSVYLAQAAELRVTDGRVQVVAGGEVVSESPAEGLWSIACDWEQHWLAGWHHAKPASIESAGEWTILKAELNACGGVWALEDAYRQHGAVIEGLRRIQWKGTGLAPRVTLTVRFDVRAARHNVLLPGIIYYGNPSGAKSGRVPVYTGAAGEEALYEEHRFPMPFASVAAERGTALWGAALHSVPSPVPYGNRPDQWWSLGVIGKEGGAEMALYSGPCASNGSRSVIKALQRGFVPYDDAYLSIPAGGLIEKRFFLEAFPVQAAGSGFQTPVRTALALSPPYSLEDVPPIAEIVRAKYRYAKTRWHESVTDAGFRKYPDRNVYVMGWTGQAEAPGFALLELAPGLDDPQAASMARRALDFLSTAEFYERGFRNWYDYEKHQWSGDELLNQGQAMLAFARAIRVARARKWNVPAWEKFLRKAADLHAARILAADWKPVATSEAVFIAPLLDCFDLFGVRAYRDAAVKAAEYYAARHLSMKEPYWGGTLDARCEDKEAAAAALQGFLALYERTHDPKHLMWARHACDVALTYVFVWDADLPAGRLRDVGFKTRGWTVVSPQNQHLDVWGVIMVPDVYRLGQLQKDDGLKRLALLMYRACGQIIDPYGSQGEQMHHTNYPALNRPGELLGGRGGYNEQWRVFWITAHFLTSAARLLEMGVPVWE